MTVTRLIAGAAVGAGTAFAWGAVVERRWFALRHVTLPVMRAGPGRPLRVLQVSDLHLLPGQDGVARFLDRCRDTGPDLVVATGDLLGHPSIIDEAVRLLARLRGDAPGLAVLGSNDLYVPTPRNPLRYLTGGQRRRVNVALDSPRLIAGLEATGWLLADNLRARVDTASGVVDVAGLGDPHIGRDRPERVDWTRAACPDPVLRLGLVHAPYLRALDVFDRQAFDLVLAGHTHGGQVRVPGVGALVANCDLPRSAVRGVSRHGAELWLHVSAGLGHSRYAPYRFACRPEASVLDLVPARLRRGLTPDVHCTAADRCAVRHRDVAQLG